MKNTLIRLECALFGFVPETCSCSECDTRFCGDEIDPNWIEPDGSFICLECRYILLLQKHRRLKRSVRLLQRAFAEIKSAVLNMSGGSRWEAILGICEAYRGKFDAHYE